jgi:UDP-N-acetylglucosamine transferase subunit ALG13
MIFVTIGSLFPFDRLIQCVDELSPEFPAERFFCQIGGGKYEPKNVPYARMLTAREFDQYVGQAKMIIAHAGMGSVITALEKSTPIVVLPRIYERGEHTTDHQMATARWLRGKPGVYVSMSSDGLAETMRSALNSTDNVADIPRGAPPQLVDAIRKYIASIVT